MKWQAIPPRLLSLVYHHLKTTHGRLIVAGLFVVFCYFPLWLRLTIGLTLKGSLGLLLNGALIYLGATQLWKNRADLAQRSATLEDRIVGYFLMAGGTATFFAYHSLIFAQVLSVAMVLVGAAYSSWGFRFFYKYWFSGLLLLISIHPNLNRVAYHLWLAFTPPDFLEQFMANWGSRLLNLIGQPAIAEGKFILLAASGVEVAPGCNGFEMAFTIAVISVLAGIALKQPLWRTVVLTGVAIALALVCNIPRIALMTLASVHWGAAAFEFWHGPIGGQIFSGVLFTIYYYLAMWFLNQKPAKTEKS